MSMILAFLAAIGRNTLAALAMLGRAALFVQDAMAAVGSLERFITNDLMDDTRALEHDVSSFIAFESQSIIGGGEVGKALERMTTLLRRHRLIELFLVRTLGLSWDEVHDEAENMEHAVSD